MLGKHGIKHIAHEFLAGLGQLGDGVELLFEAGDRPTPCAARRGGRDPGRVVVGDQRLDRDAQHLGETGEHGDGHAALAEFIEGELGLREAQRLGQLHLCQIGGGAGLGDALTERLKIGLFVGAHGGLCGPDGEAMHERNTCFCG